MICPSEEVWGSKKKIGLRPEPWEVLPDKDWAEEEHQERRLRKRARENPGDYLESHGEVGLQGTGDNTLKCCGG